MRSSTSGLRKGAWTEEEDSLLRKCIEKYGEGKWHQVPYRAALNRCRKSCRLRWLNYLRPNIKRGNFGLDEVELIIRLHKLLGNRWSLIAGRLPGRTANDVKNYWNTYIKKKLDDGDGGTKLEAGNSSRRSEEAPTTTASTIFKPRPRTFSKNAPWLRQIAETATTTNTRSTTDDQDSGTTNTATSSVPKSLSLVDHDMQWLENLFNDKDMVMSEGQCWPPFCDFGDDRIEGLWSDELWSGWSKEGDGQNDSGDFCIDALL